MDYASTFSSSENHSHNCDYCGAEIGVTITKQTGHNEREEYNCPECTKTYSVRASLPIMPYNIKLLNPRNDGRTDKFQNPEK